MPIAAPFLRADLFVGPFVIFGGFAALIGLAAFVSSPAEPAGPEPPASSGVSPVIFTANRESIHMITADIMANGMFINLPPIGIQTLKLL
jgi:hypothetical protein